MAVLFGCNILYIEVSELTTDMTSDEQSRYEDISTNYVASYTIAEG